MKEEKRKKTKWITEKGMKTKKKQGRYVYKGRTKTSKTKVN